MQEFNQLTPHPGQFRKFRQPENAGKSKTDLLAADTAWRLWTVMGEIFSNRWTQKKQGGALGYVDCPDWIDE
ncbi:hypothetical protein LNP25_19490 [Klebsiella variicola subsp. variicola]|nr:hypothetical protein [Klebsiella variicola subsp. variicola]